MVHVNFSGSKITIYPTKKAQMALLLAKEITVLAKYSNFADMFFEQSANILPEQTNVDEHAIKLEKSKQPLYGPIYSLGPVELNPYKSYIETNLANGFIQTSKSLAGALILIIHKSNDRFCLCVNYWWLNNLTIKNWYLFSLIIKSLDWLGRAKQVT